MYATPFSRCKLMRASAGAVAICHRKEAGWCTAGTALTGTPRAQREPKSPPDSNASSGQTPRAGRLFPVGADADPYDSSVLQDDQRSPGHACNFARPPCCAPQCPISRCQITAEDGRSFRVGTHELSPASNRTGLGPVLSYKDHSSASGSGR